MTDRWSQEEVESVARWLAKRDLRDGLAWVHYTDDAFAVLEASGAVPVEEAEQTRRAMWEQQESRLDEYREVNTAQKHRIRELEAELEALRSRDGAIAEELRAVADSYEVDGSRPKLVSFLRERADRLVSEEAGAEEKPKENAMQHCPTCDSPAPQLHPAVQHEGEVQPCADPYHEQPWESVPPDCRQEKA